MEGQNHHENLVQLMSSSYGGNPSYFSHSPEDALYLNCFTTAANNQSLPVSMSQPHWLNDHQTYHKYVEILQESGVSDTQRERGVSCSNWGVVSGFNPSDLCLDMDAQKGNYTLPHTEGGPSNITSAEYQIQCQKQGKHENFQNASQPQLRVAVDAPSFRSKQAKPRSIVSRQRATATDRHRRLRIAEKLDALQELLPHSKEDGKASLLGETIEHIKNLQLQIKDLSQSRLGGQSTSDPYIFLEGYGHYLIQDQMVGEPLEEMMGKLLEANPSAAAQLLESRGLYVIPVTLAEGLSQSL